MSRTYSIGCTQCRTCLWIGQGTAARRYIYAAPKYIQALDDFLFAHEGHPLIFGDDEGKFAGYTEIGDPASDEPGFNQPLPTQDQKARIESLAKDLRKIASPVGPMHSFWDVIHDMEAVVHGKESFVKMSPGAWIKEAEQMLEEHRRGRGSIR